ncbi:MAG TPA: TetR/AcrR family transcriptional regulator C-terminal domain-containing protein [Tepidiformaceae bacterium]|nr:TetR/AcrR family transcriptional regulator C-terminal domain-containing protein [Tepidiformaceae bacterium]
MATTQRLNKARIVAAALAIADEEGFAALSMRRVAQELGVATMSLYYYAKSKAELISAMDDALMAEILVPNLPEDWREALTAIAGRTRDVFVRHPWALSSMQSAPPGDNAMRHMEQCLGALATTGMTTKDKLTLLALVDDFVFGYALRETAEDPVVDMDAVKKRLATGIYPELNRTFGKELRMSIPNRFGLGLDAIFAKFGERRVVRRTRHRRRRRKSVE